MRYGHVARPLRCYWSALAKYYAVRLPLPRTVQTRVLALSVRNVTQVTPNNVSFRQTQCFFFAGVTFKYKCLLYPTI